MTFASRFHLADDLARCAGDGAMPAWLELVGDVQPNRSAK